MSFTDPSAEPAQPEEGQGSEASGGGSPWEQHLTRFPDDLREEAASVFKEMEGDFTKRFMEASEYRKQLEPYEQLGITQLDPQDVAYGLQLQQAMSNPQVMQEWWNSYAQANGLSQPSTEPEVPADDFGMFGDPAQLQSLIEQQTGPLKQQLEQFQGYIEQQQQQAEQAQLMSKLESQVSELERTKNGGKPFTDEEKEVLARFAMRYDDADTAIPRGFEDMQTFRNAIEKQALQAKVDAPNPAEGGGVPDVTAPQFKGLNDPALKAAAMQHLRNDR